MSGRALVAVFVGGKSRRMGTPKGLLKAPRSGLPIVDHLVSVAAEAGLDVVLVGEATPYAGLAKRVPRLCDVPPRAGPLGGLHAAVRHAVDHGYAHVIAVACDMPFVTAEALTELAEYPSDATVLARRRMADGPWEPMLARYQARSLADVLDTAIADGQRSFQGLFASIAVERLPPIAAVDRALRDWDTPGDIGA